MKVDTLHTLSAFELLPDENATLAAFETTIKREVVLCERLLRFGVSLLDNDCDLHQGSLRHDTVITAVGLYVKAATTFRACMQLCRYGCDRHAMPVTRSLYETYLYLAFLLRRRVTLYQFNDTNRTRPRTPLKLHGKTLTTAFRTDLYNAWVTLRDEKDIERLATTPGTKLFGRRLKNRMCGTECPYVAAIGVDWAKAIRGGSTCVGLSIKDFAVSLNDRMRFYHSLRYSLDSKHVHQADSQDFLDCDDTNGIYAPKWFTSPSESRLRLNTAAALLLGCIQEFQKRFRFGSSVTESIRQFSNDLQASE